MRKMSSGIVISSWCIVVHIMSKGSLLRGSLSVTLSASYMILFIVSSSQAPNVAAYVPLGTTIIALVAQYLHRLIHSSMYWLFNYMYRPMSRRLTG